MDSEGDWISLGSSSPPAGFINLLGAEESQQCLFEPVPECQRRRWHQFQKSSVSVFAQFESSNPRNCPEFPEACDRYRDRFWADITSGRRRLRLNQIPSQS